MNLTFSIVYMDVIISLGCINQFYNIKSNQCQCMVVGETRCSIRSLKKSELEQSDVYISSKYEVLWLPMTNDSIKSNPRAHPGHQHMERRKRSQGGMFQMAGGGGRTGSWSTLATFYPSIFSLSLSNNMLHNDDKS